jgi:hypothetical protein
MPRCGSCNKFVSLDTEVDADLRLEVNPQGQVSGTCEIQNTCAECGDALRTAAFDVEENVLEKVEAHRLADHPQEKILTLELVGEEATRTERSGKGKRAARFYGVEIRASVQCGLCEAEIAVIETSDEIQASAMEEM